MTDPPGLFDIDPDWRAVRQGLTARRTARQRFLISVGLHPLSLHLRRALKLHWRASRQPVAATRLAHPTCGTCVHLGYLDRFPDGTPNSAHLRCWFNGGERVTRGNATDARRWWPACRDYEQRTPRDGTDE